MYNNALELGIEVRPSAIASMPNMPSTVLLCQSREQEDAKALQAMFLFAQAERLENHSSVLIPQTHDLKPQEMNVHACYSRSNVACTTPNFLSSCMQ
jgi:hypothetical protein